MAGERRVKLHYGPKILNYSVVTWYNFHHSPAATYAQQMVKGNPCQIVLSVIVYPDTSDI